MYLSRLLLNDTSNCHEVHRVVMSAFPSATGQSARAKFSVLYRADGHVVLVQSTVKPDWSGVAAIKNIETILASLRHGDYLRFRARVNATWVKDGKRVGILEEERWFEWLHRKARDGGFEFKDNDVVARRERDVVGRKDGHELTFFTVLFDGRLSVTRPDAFREMIRAGIGPAKAYGFGLLSIAPVVGLNG